MNEDDNVKEVVRPRMMLLPPAEGKCRICAVQHEPDEPHNATSLFYQVRFRMRYERDGTWADALAHCSAEVRQKWEEALRKADVWTETPEGITPRAEPIDG